MTNDENQPFYAPNRTTAPRQPRTGEHLWTVQKDGRQLACELRDDGGAGVEVLVSRNGELLYGRPWATRALALEEADERKAQYVRDGGVLIA
jgi:hypothetical protein